MKDLRTGLFAFLAADGPIGAVVTSGGIARIYPGFLPQSTKLASIVYQRISGGGDYTMQGSSGLVHPRYQIAAWAPTVLEAGTLANKIKDALDGYKGVMGDVSVQGVFFADEREGYDDVVKLYGVMRDYFIWHEER